MGRLMNIKTGKELLEIADKYIENTSNFGHNKSKITEEMVILGLILREKGGTLKNIQSFFFESYNVDSTIQNIRQRMNRYKQKNKDFIAEIETKQSQISPIKVIETQRNERTQTTKPIEKSRQTTQPSFNTQAEKEDETPSVILTDEEKNDPDIVVLNGKKYRKKKRLWKSDNPKLEADIDRFEEEINSGERKTNKTIYHLAWQSMACRYSSNTELIKYLSQDLRFSQVPREFQKEYITCREGERAEYLHLEEII